MKFIGKWTFACSRIGNGSKQLGFGLWWNAQRVGFELNVGLYTLMVMREFK